MADQLILFVHTWVSNPLAYLEDFIEYVNSPYLSPKSNISLHSHCHSILFTVFTIWYLPLSPKDLGQCLEHALMDQKYNCHSGTLAGLALCNPKIGLLVVWQCKTMIRNESKEKCENHHQHQHKMPMPCQ